MTSNIQAAFGVAAFILVFIPAGLMVYASVGVLKYVKDYAAILIAVGAIILTIASLDFLYVILIALLFSAQELAAYSIYSVFIFKALDYLALLLIAIGLLRFCRTARSLAEKPVGQVAQG